MIYNDFLDKFGEEGNLIVIAVNDSTLFTPEKFTAWNTLTKKLGNYSEVDHVISLGNLKKLQKFNNPKRFEMVPLIKEEKWDSAKVAEYQDELFNKLPFYENLVYSSNSNTVQTALYINEDIVNSKERKTFVIDELKPLMAMSAEERINTRIEKFSEMGEVVE